MPPLGWVERAYRQAKKHLPAATPAALARLLWAWGEWGYSPRDRPFANDLKNALRRALAARRLRDGRELVMALHGVARLEAEYWPNAGWAQLFAARARPELARLPTGAQRSAARLVWRADGVWALFACHSL